MARKGPNAKGSSGGRKGGGGGGASGGGSASSGAIRAGAAFVELFAKDSLLDSGLKNASAKLKSWATAMAKVGGIVLGGGAAALAGIGAAVKSITDRGTELSRIALVYGDTVENISALQYAADASGAGAERLQQAMENMPERIFDAVNGSTELNKNFAALGVSAGELNGKPFSEQLLMMADGFQQLDTATRRAGIASKLFSDVGLEGMIPLLSSGRKQLQAWFDEAKKVGAVMTTSEAKKSVEVSRVMLQVWTGLKSIFNESVYALVNFISASKQYVDPVNSIIQTVRQWVKENSAIVLTITAIAGAAVAGGAALIGLASVIGAAGTVLGLVVPLVKALAAGFVFLISPAGVITGLLVAGVAAWVNYSSAGAESLKVIKDGWQGVVDSIMAGDLQAALKIVSTGFKLAWDTLVFDLKSSWQDFIRFVRDSFAVIENERSRLVDRGAANLGIVGEAMGLVPGGTGNLLLNDQGQNERDRVRKMLEEVNRNRDQRNSALGADRAAVDAANAEYQALLEKAKKKRMAGLGEQLAPGGGDNQRIPISTATLGAFGFNNASQLFGGSSTYQGQMLKATERGNELLEDIANELRGVVTLRIR